MSTLAEKLRACLALDNKAVANVYVAAGRCLLLGTEDLEAIADALDEHDDVTSCAANTADAPEVRLEEREADAEAVAWMDERLAFTDSKLVAQRWSEEGKRVVPLYAHPPVPEAEDFERRLIDALAYELARLNCRLDVTPHSVRILHKGQVVYADSVGTVIGVVGWLSDVATGKKVVG